MQSEMTEIPRNTHTHDKRTSRAIVGYMPQEHTYTSRAMLKICTTEVDAHTKIKE